MYQTHHFKDKFILVLNDIFPYPDLSICQLFCLLCWYVLWQANTIPWTWLVCLWQPVSGILSSHSWQGLCQLWCLSLVTILVEVKRKRLRLIFDQFIYLALGLSVVLLGMVLLLAPPILNHIGLEAPVAAVAVRYLWFLSIGIIPLLLFSVIRSLLDSLGLTKLSMYLMLCYFPWIVDLTISWFTGPLVFQNWEVLVLV